MATFLVHGGLSQKSFATNIKHDAPDKCGRYKVVQQTCSKLAKALLEERGITIESDCLLNDLKEMSVGQALSLTCTMIFMTVG